MRHGALSVLAAILLAAGGAAHAQDGDAPVPVEAKADGLRIEAVALDYSSMLKSQHGASAQLTPLPLVETDISIAVLAPGVDTRVIPGDDGDPVRTDADGRFSADIGELPPGATLHFFVPHGTAGDQPGYYARPWDAEAGEPLDQVRFFEVADTAERVFQRVMQVVTVIEEGGPGEKAIQLRHIAFVQNQSFGVWLGDLASDTPGSFHIPVPAGYELRDVRVDRQPVATDTVAVGHGGTMFVHRDPIFPTVPGQKDAYMFTAVLIGPYVDGALVDLSWHAELPIDEYRLSLETPALVYAAPEASSGRLALQDGGENPPMGNTPKATHSWGATGIRAHTDLGVVFTVGKPFPWRPTLMTLAMLLIALAAVLLGRSLARRGGPPQVEAASADTALSDLERRRKSGEITSVEYEIRHRALAGGGSPVGTSGLGTSAIGTTGAPAAPRPPPSPAADASRQGLLRDLDEIVRRAPDSGEGELRADVRTLARALRDLLEG